LCCHVGRVDYGSRPLFADVLCICVYPRGEYQGSHKPRSSPALLRSGCGAARPNVRLHLELPHVFSFHRSGDPSLLEPHATRLPPAVLSMLLRTPDSFDLETLLWVLQVR
jgi:hypothetical protein